MEADKLKCPKCGAEYDDDDGLLFTYCSRCGYCTHGSTTRKRHLEVCEICGRETRLERLAPLLCRQIEMNGQRVLSVKNPWAYLIIRHGKDVENRRQQTKYRGRILIHASKTSDMYGYERRWGDNEAMQKIFDSLIDNIYEVEKTNGHIIGSAELYDCVKGLQSVWAENLPEPYTQHHWLFRDPHPFDVPLPARGMLGLWTYESPLTFGKE
ncbi:hypothetical protein AGMMS50268_09290 [Spirochaetia bacterium]|nr:hypothetical protein AGMMS50268_09290 [Spirochaetia bacterium]